MYTLEGLFDVLNRAAPLKLSDLFVQKEGAYDNSGIIVRSQEEVKGVLFSLDISLAAVERAKQLGCDTLVTHHPAIYSPIKRMGACDAASAPIYAAVRAGLNVVSMHLNLDTADFGIDESLCEGLGGVEPELLSRVDETHGYGRQFCVKKTSFDDFVEMVKSNFRTDRVVTYGDGEVERVASFCGGGSSDAVKALESGSLTADTVVTSDMPHHVIKELVENNVKILLMPHYSAENYGFKRFFEKTKSQIDNEVAVRFFEDKRFM